MGSKPAVAIVAMSLSMGVKGTRNIKCVEEERFDGTTTPAEMRSFAGSSGGFDFGSSAFRGEIYAMLQQVLRFVINSGSGADNIGNMTPLRAMIFIKTINGTLKLSKLDKLFKESHTCHIVTALPVPLRLFGDEESSARGAAAQDLAQRVL
ncbi:hypothetical protein T492DRAFT_911120 [Pavlovales sp. CCMP2436]|nr:hypothetical protein T492DRAFT_911120 [Pavlovales sp. CCMP2436]